MASGHLYGDTVLNSSQARVSVLFFCLTAPFNLAFQIWNEAREAVPKLTVVTEPFFRGHRTLTVVTEPFCPLLPTSSGHCHLGSVSLALSKMVASRKAGK